MDLEDRKYPRLASNSPKTCLQLNSRSFIIFFKMTSTVQRGLTKPSTHPGEEAHSTLEHMTLLILPILGALLLILFLIPTIYLSLN